MSGVALSLWTIYYEPWDMPGVKYAVRRFEITAGQTLPTDDVTIASTLVQARRLVPLSADLCIARSPDDDPVIVETWL